jgi:O-antigen/teichoic acid export membrane protein
MGGFLLVRMVEPSDLGVFNGIALSIDYSAFLQLGILTGLNRELPYCLGQKNLARARDLTGAAEAWVLWAASAAAAALLGMAVWQGYHQHWHQLAAWGTMAVSVFVYLYGTLYLHTTYRTRGDFARLAVVNIVENTAALVLLVLVLFLGFYGLCLRSLVVSLLAGLLLWVQRPMPVRPRWDWRLLGDLLKIGLPLFASNQLLTWWSLLDSTLVVSYLGTASFGLYALAVMLAGIVRLLFYHSVSHVVYPCLAEEFGRTGDLGRLLKIVRRPTAYLALGMVPVVAVGWLALPPVTAWLFPQYGAGVPAAQWALVAAGILSLSPPCLIFAVLNRPHLYALGAVSGVVVYGVSVLWLGRGGMYLEAFPQAMVLGNAGYILVSYALLFYFVRGRIVRHAPE